MTRSDGCIAKVISLFFRSPNHRRPRISAADEMSMAVNSLQNSQPRRAGAHVCCAGLQRSVMGNPRAVEGVLDPAVTGPDDIGGNGADKGIECLCADRV